MLDGFEGVSQGLYRREVTDVLTEGRHGHACGDLHRRRRGPRGAQAAVPGANHRGGPEA
jgi:hypothetical protein